MRSRSFPLLILVIILLSACAHDINECTDELSWHVSPTKKTIEIGESFRINVDATTCDGREKVTMDWYFKSKDESIAVVDSKGFVIGNGKGNTEISVSIVESDIGAFWVDITVK